MRRQGSAYVVVVIATVLGIAAACLARKEPARPIQPVYPVYETLPPPGPYVIIQRPPASWVQVHVDTSYCPGDPLGGHGGEATGEPDGAETWCFEGALYIAEFGNEPVTVSDTCGTNPPYDLLCFDHVDVRRLPSQTDTNFWHIDVFRTIQRPYCGSFCMWCGSAALWTDGQPVECNTWANPPGYGNQWNCVLELELPDTFSVAAGCTVYFDPRYDTECKYDFFYFEVWDGYSWITLATFNATSDNPGPVCGDPLIPSPDYWGNTDINNLVNCNWQTRAYPSRPAFEMYISPDTLNMVHSGPRFRWRFESDAVWSDADGFGDTDGGAFIDNVWVRGDEGHRYTEDFEHGSWAVLAARGWSKPNHEGILQAWHQVHDPDPPYEGGDGGDRASCLLDSSLIWRARPQQGYPGPMPWRNGWFYRLLSPSIPIHNTGCVIQYDQYMCTQPYTCDYTDTKVRFHDTRYARWCPWVNIDGYILFGGCDFWNFDFEEEVTHFYGSAHDSVQFAWDIMDLHNPWEDCRGKHKSTDNLIDNVSVGFFNGSASVFTARVIDLLHDTFHDSLCAVNSSFPSYNADSLIYYAGPPYAPPPVGYQLLVDVHDKDLIQQVRLYASDSYGQTWIWVPMSLYEATDPLIPAQGGSYYGTVCPDDFGYVSWPRGTQIWYYIRCTDMLSNLEYFPAQADPGHPEHTNTLYDYFSFSVLPLHPEDFLDSRILFVDGFGRWISEWSPCLEDVTRRHSGLERGLEEIYEQVLIDCGYCYDKFDINGAGCNVHIHPVEFADHYDCVIWTTGPYFIDYLIDSEAQHAIKEYLWDGGKVVLWGDRLAYNMEPPPEGLGADALAGEFLAGVMGTDYLGPMPDPYEKPYVYMKAAPACSVFGSEVPISPDHLDTLVLYRWCPGRLKEMDYVLTNASPPPGYTAQPLLYVLNPEPEYDPADGAIYMEIPESGGQCVFLNFDMSGLVSYRTRYCTGATPDGVPPFVPGTYDGRVELMSTILDVIMGLPPTHPGAKNGGGGGGTSDVKPAEATYRWVLAQNKPNPAMGRTEIRFEVAHPSRVSIRVYNAMGQLVRTLVNERREPGRYTVHWNGLNDSGRKVSTGVYFYRMQARNFAATKKMLLLD